MKTLIKLSLILSALILCACSGGEYENDKPLTVIGTSDTATR